MLVAKVGILVNAKPNISYTALHIAAAALCVQARTPIPIKGMSRRQARAAMRLPLLPNRWLGV